jgi:hypothetical protein
VSALVAAAGAAVSSYAPPWLLQKIGKGGMTVASIAIMVAAIVFFQTVTEFLFLRRSLFRRLVSFGEFIEGHWVEVKFLYNPATKRREVVGGSFVTISYASGKLMCRGVFYENGRQKGDFVSRTAAFDGTALDYSFAGTDTDAVHGEIVPTNGWGHFEFEPAVSGSPWNSPSRYSAQVSHAFEAAIVAIEGRRITEPSTDLTDDRRATIVKEAMDAAI